MQALGKNDVAWVKVSGVMVSVKTETMTYPACDQDYNGRKCQKKMTDLQDPEGLYNCDRCSTSSLPNWRYLLNCRFADFTGTLEHVSIFGEAGEAIMGMPATQAHEVRASPPCPLFWHLMLCNSCKHSKSQSPVVLPDECMVSTALVLPALARALQPCRVLPQLRVLLLRGALSLVGTCGQSEAGQCR